MLILDLGNFPLVENVPVAQGKPRWKRMRSQNSLSALSKC